MMKMDGRDSTEYQIWEIKGQRSIREKFKSLKDKRSIVTCLLQNEKGRKRGGEGKERSSSFGSDFFRERESSFSLRL